MSGDALTGTMTYDEMLAALQARYSLDPSHARQVHNRWMKIGKGSRSPAWAIGSKYI